MFCIIDRKINARFAVQIIDPKKIILIINKLTESDQGIYTCATGYDTRSFSVSKEIKLYSEFNSIIFLLTAENKIYIKIQH